MGTLNSAYEKDPNKAPKIVFVMKGTFQGNNACAFMNYPLIMIGAGQNKTFLSGYSFEIKGTKVEGKRVVLKDMTVCDSQYSGVCGNGLSFLCDNITITRCRRNGVLALNTKGRLINCAITQCGRSGVYCHRNALIELEGSQTKVHGNVTSGDSDRYTYGLHTDSSSIIHLLSPLTKESVSTNNHNGQNYGTDSYGGGSGCIETVDSFDDESDDDN